MVAENKKVLRLGRRFIGGPNNFFWTINMDLYKQIRCNLYSFSQKRWIALNKVYEIYDSIKDMPEVRDMYLNQFNPIKR